MKYKVVLTTKAKADFEQIIHYLLYELKSGQAATNVANDIELTIERLSRNADGIGLCQDLRLCNLGYRIMHFKRHKYIMLYRIENDTVYIDAIYHSLQDYENVLK